MAGSSKREWSNIYGHEIIYNTLCWMVECRCTCMNVSFLCNDTYWIYQEKTVIMGTEKLSLFFETLLTVDMPNCFKFVLKYGICSDSAQQRYTHHWRHGTSCLPDTMVILRACDLSPPVPVWISNYLQCNMWEEITYPFPNFNDDNRWSLRMGK